MNARPNCSTYERPEPGINRSLSINGGTVSLQLSVSYNAMGGFWQMNIADQTGTPIVGPVPTATGAYTAGNILAPYQYMNIGSAFVINVSGIVDTVNGVPVDRRETNLGTGYVCYFWDDNTNYVPASLRRRVGYSDSRASRSARSSPVLLAACISWARWAT